MNKMFLYICKNIKTKSDEKTNAIKSTNTIRTTSRVYLRHPIARYGSSGYYLQPKTLKMSHEANEKQIKAFKELEKALKKCKKLGLVIYAKQWDLVAYTKDADNYAEETNKSIMEIGSYGIVPYLSFSGLADSGADDYARYVTQEDEDKYLKD